MYIHQAFRINGQPYQQFLLNKNLHQTAIELVDFIKKWEDDNVTLEAFTSGSTGTPKSIQLYKKDMLASAALTNDFFNIEQHSNLLLSLSIEYIAGMMMCVRAMLAGTNLTVVSPKLNPLKEIDHRCTLVALVPLQVETILHESPEKIELVDYFIIGGAPIDSKLEQKLLNYPHRFWATYGMTETVSHIALREVDGSSPFQAMPNILFSQSSEGGLIITTPHFTTKEHCTRDFVELLSPTSFRWLGRLDNVINSGGVKVTPQLLEEKISPYIEVRFYIAGLKHEKWGEQVTLYIEDMPWCETKISTFVEKCRKLIPSKQMFKEIYFIDQFEETKTQKVKRIAFQEEENGVKKRSRV